MGSRPSCYYQVVDDAGILFKGVCYSGVGWIDQFAYAETLTWLG
jgi:hypothetical protein